MLNSLATVGQRKPVQTSPSRLEVEDVLKLLDANPTDAGSFRRVGRVLADSETLGVYFKSWGRVAFKVEDAASNPLEQANLRSNFLMALKQELQGMSTGLTQPIMQATLANENSTKLFAEPLIAQLNNEACRTIVGKLLYALQTHPIYKEINEKSLRTFMEYHAFCVWDFQTLLASLCNTFSPNKVPWTPPENEGAARLVHDLVREERSDKVTDTDGDVRYISHYNLYLEAMESAGANTQPIRGLVGDIDSGVPLDQALNKPEIPSGVAQFVQTTMRFSNSGNKYQKLGAFGLGREDATPTIFTPVLEKIISNQANTGERNTNWQPLKEYLGRHIHLDNDEHGPGCISLLNELCGDNAEHWKDTTDAARDALQSRIKLWDCILEEIRSRKT